MRILIAEDEFLITATIEETLENAGAEVVTAATLDAAIGAAEHEKVLSAAILDIRLGRQTTESVVDALSARAVPVVFYSGQPLPMSMKDKYPTLKILIKPARQSELVTAIAEAIDTGSSSSHH
ncbi:response regulator [Labrys okinawensis]|nr:response regulator [Labrys okinawensis]